MIGALAVACFVKLLGTVFLGSPRGDAVDHAHDAHDAPRTMILPMAALAVGCASLGLFPMIAAPLLENAAETWAALPEATASMAAVAPLGWITALGLGLIALVTVIVVAVGASPRANVVGKADTWGCGYARPTTRMQYSGSSFGQMIVSLFTFILWPRIHRPDIRGLFGKTAHFKSIVPDTVLDRVVQPLFSAAGRHLPGLRVLQQGQTQLYVLYVLVIMIVLLIWSAIGAHP
jgi:hydrogenase-4 component B